ncbi:flagellar motor switch protein FliM [Clostridium tertium]|jgi:flagellar motor switch protein FliM|uniref:Flagellar motor switch protein FliM n=1 Tax=Clostridium tertium TaxID=1559 RepID=A0A9X3XPZ3_9CLOT|nr:MULTISPECIES: flagellar motor switch protein FliM [Clostridium]EEH98390.1 flagellar motor switch protein FliM [Clostridium sp. 7_2_43FAA]MBP1866753.1 flagellar motor switch protein FliM [Clostridium tertium]MBS6502000.1 flagellar motor switch protein FliM [Clostridium sp.]MBU6135938.1 flagellar motor switch protein FliM [Clostridium tertium]MDB1922498.1 flagellar motor switch protein FliM [Clostridium tertium]
MAEVLSQSEIDALLSALSTGDVEPEQLKEKEEKQKIKKYDFRSPQKFSKDHIRTLEMVHDAFARIISNYLSGQLRKHVKVDIQSVEQITYEEFVHSIANPTILTIFKMPPLQGNILLEMNPQFSFQILDILLGGTGDRDEKAKEFSEIDKNILANITSEMIKSLILAWDGILEVKPEFEGLETNPSANQTLAPNEPVALLSFLVELGKSTTYMNLCIPYLSVEKVLDKLVVQYWFKTDESELEDEAREKLKKGLDPVKVNMHVELGKTEITVDDFLELVNGDVLVLNSQYSDPVRVFVENEECFIAKPGIVGKNMGIQLLDILDKDVIENE